MSKDLHGFFKESESGYIPPKRKRGRGSQRRRKLKYKEKKKAYIHFLLYEARGKQFYNSRAWRRMRKKVLNNYPHKCMCCGDEDSVLHVDHIQPRSRKPELGLTYDNLQILCKHCNEQKSNIHAEDYR